MIDLERHSTDGIVLPWVRREHDARYEFAARYVKDRVVVDCACGTGIGTGVFAKAGAHRVLAFDASSAAVETTRRRASPNVEAAVADACHIPVRDGLAEVFVSLETIEHVEDDERYLAEVARVVAPGGVFVCSTPNRTVTNPGLPADGRPFNRFHVREYSAQEFVALLRTHFDVIEMFGQNPRPRVLTRGLAAAGRVLPFRFATRAAQAGKLTYLLPGRAAGHEVRSSLPWMDYEYLVAVCRRSGAPAATGDALRHLS